MGYVSELDISQIADRFTYPERTAASAFVAI
jgi:hypothetical protein